MRERDERPLLPHNPASYLTDWLFDVGPGASAAMGEGVLAYTDLAAWQAINGVELLPWEAKVLRRLSGEYLSERQKAEEPAQPPPYTGTSDKAATRDRVAEQFRAAMSQRKRKD